MRTLIRNLFFKPIEGRPKLDPFPGLNPPTAAPKIPQAPIPASQKESDIERLYKKFKERSTSVERKTEKPKWTLNDD